MPFPDTTEFDPIQAILSGATLPARRPLPPYAIPTSLNSNPLPPLQPLNLPQAPPDEPGWLEYLGLSADKPGNAIRSILAGKPHGALSAIPFSDTFGLTDRSDHTSGQDVNNALFGIPKTDDFLTPSGLAGIGTELLTDPLTWLGIGGVTHTGEAAANIGGHLLEAGNLASSAMKAEKAARAAEALAMGVEHTGAINGFEHVSKNYGQLVRDGLQVPDREIVEHLANPANYKLGNPIGDAARGALDAADSGIGDAAFRPIEGAGDATRGGQRALLQVNDHIDPFGLARLGGNFNPINWLPKVPGLTAPLQMPWGTKTLIEGAPVMQAASDATKFLGGLPVIKQGLGLLDTADKAAGSVKGKLKGLYSDTLGDMRGKISQADKGAAELQSALVKNLDPNTPKPPPPEPGTPGFIPPPEPPKGPTPSTPDVFREGPAVAAPPIPPDQDPAFLASLHPDTPNMPGATRNKILEVSDKLKAMEAARNPKTPLESAFTEAEKAINESHDFKEPAPVVKQSLTAQPTDDAFPLAADPTVAENATIRNPRTVEPSVEHLKADDRGVLLAGDIATDPQRFQYKLSPGKTGSTGSIQGDFNRDLVGSLDVWRDPADGKTYVINGHNRLDAVKRNLGSQEPLDVRYIHAADASEARAQGAILNIAEKHGDPFDAATFIRETGATQEQLRANGIDLNNGMGRNGLALSKLDPEVFSLAKNEALPMEHAAYLGENVPNLKDQREIARRVASRPESPSLKSLKEYVEEFQHAPVVESKGKTLWGDDAEADNLGFIKSDLIADVKAKVSGTARTFSGISSDAKAGTIGEAGAGKINQAKATKEAARQKILLADIDTYKHNGLNQTFDEAAKRINNGEPRAQVTAETLDRVRELLKDPNALRQAQPSRMGQDLGSLESAPSGGRTAPSSPAVAPEQFRESPPPQSQVNAFTDLTGEKKAALVGSQGHGEQTEFFEAPHDFSPKEIADQHAAADLHESEAARLQREKAEGQNFMFEEPKPAPTAQPNSKPSDLLREPLGTRNPELGTPSKLSRARAASGLDTADEALQFRERPSAAPNSKVDQTPINIDPSPDELSWHAQQAAKQFQQRFSASPEDANAAAALMDARAKSWARTTGNDTRDWYNSRWAGVADEAATHNFIESNPGKLKGSHAAVQFLDDGRAVLHAFQNADIGSVIHEMGHVLRRDLSGPELEAAAAWAGQKNPSAGWTVKAEEKFANAFTDYVHTGNSPTPELEGTFAKLKSSLSDIWERLKSMVKGTPAESRATFDKLLGSEPIEERALPKRSGPKILEAASDPDKLPALRQAYNEAMAQREALTRGTPEWKAADKQMRSIGDDMTAEGQRQNFGDQQSAASKLRANMTAYLNKAGMQSGDAANAASKILPPDLAPEVGRRVTDLIEKGGHDAPEFLDAVGAIQAKYESMIKAEEAAGLRSPRLNSDRIDYATHTGTSYAKRFFSDVNKDPEKAAALFKSLEEARQARGVAPNPDALKTPFEQQMKRIAGHEPALSVDIPNKMGADAREAFGENMPGDAGAWIKRQGLQKQFDAFTQQISAAHESQIPRLDAYRDLSAPELNDIFKQHGAKATVFNENPAAQLHSRELRHIRAMAAHDFLENAGLAAGKPFENAIPIGDAKNGILNVKLPDGSTGATIDKLPGTVFPDRGTAQAILDMHGRLNEPEQSHQLLQWYDQLTSAWKGYLTRAFPGYHLHNHIDNYLQSWLGGVDLSHEAGPLAAKIMGGKEVSVKTPMGLLDGEGVRQLAENHGVTWGGYFDQTAKEAMDATHESSWNPLDPQNKFIKTGEKLSVGITNLPGQAMNGTLNNAFKVNGSTLEQQDRLRHFIAKLQAGESPAAAAKSVHDFLFDYSKDQLSDFDRNVMNRVAFFYPYMRNIVPMIAANVHKSLDKMAALMRLGIQPGKPDREPGYVKDSISIPHGSDANGNREEIYGIRHPVEAAISPFVTNPLEELNPLLKIPAELASGQDFFLKEPIKDARNAPHWVDSLPEFAQHALGTEHIPTKTGERTEINPYASYALREGPWSRASNTASRAFDDRKGLLDNTINLFTGARAVSVDDELEQRKAQRAAIVAKLQELEHQGKAREFTTYSPKDAQGNKDPEAQNLVKALTAKQK